MTLASSEAERIGRDYDDSACEFCERYKKSGLSSSSKILLSLLVEEGLKDRSVLELGCGAGGFLVEIIKQGAVAGVGIDLSPKMIALASELTSSSGLDKRTQFKVGNAATAELPSSYFVVLDKVICCYSEIGLLLRNATEASRTVLGFVVPRDEGILKWPFRSGVWIMNLFQRQRQGILFYLHSLRALDRTLRSSGFVLQAKHGSRFWLVLVYKRVPR